MTAVRRPRRVTFDNLLNSSARYRSQIERLALDPNRPVNDRLRYLFTIQRGEGRQSYNSIPAIENLRRAADGRLILAPAIGGLVVGVLDRSDPWDIVLTEAQRSGVQEPTLGLQARFACARTIDHTHTVYGVGYGGGETSRELGADVSTLEDLAVPLDLGTDPLGHENFATRVHEASKRISVGPSAIHAHIDGLEGLSDGQHRELHAAATLAAFVVGSELPPDTLATILR